MTYISGGDGGGRVAAAYSFAKDWAERVGWTAVEVAAGVGVVELGELPPWLAVPIAAGLAAVKGYAARQLTRNGTASTAPGV